MSDRTPGSLRCSAQGQVSGRERNESARPAHFSTLLPTQVQNVRGTGSGEPNVRLAITVDVAYGEPIGRAGLLSEDYFDESLARSIVDEDGVWPFGVAENDVGTTIAIQVCGGHCVRRPLFVGDMKSSGESPFAVVHVHRQRSGRFIADNQIDGSVTVEIHRCAGARRSIWRSERDRSCEPGFAVIEVDVALPSVPAWHREIDMAVFVEISWYDRRR